MATRNMGESGKAGRRAALLAFAAAALWACAPNGDEGMQDARTPNPRPDLQKIIVEFSLPGEADEQAAMPGRTAGTAREGTAAREVAERILSRLGPRARQSARTFDLLPMIALEADTATMMLLLRMPEVLSIQPDREVPMPSPSEGMMVPSVPAGAETEQAPVVRP